MTAPDPAEAVLWRGKPDRFPVFHRSDRLFVPFAIFLTAFVAYFSVVPSLTSDRTIDRVMAVVLTAFALYQLVGRLVVRQVVLRGTEYVVTGRHVVVKSKPFGLSRTRTSPLDRLQPPVVSESADGTGSITFGDAGLFYGMTRGADQPPELEHVPDARQVRDLIAEAQRKAMTGGR